MTGQLGSRITFHLNRFVDMVPRWCREFTLIPPLLRWSLFELAWITGA